MQRQKYSCALKINTFIVSFHGYNPSLETHEAQYLGHRFIVYYYIYSEVCLFHLKAVSQELPGDFPFQIYLVLLRVQSSGYTRKGCINGSKLSYSDPSAGKVGPRIKRFSFR